MAEKNIEKKNKIDNSKVNLQEILGDIKEVVSEEKESLFSVNEYKTVTLKKENLVESGRKKTSSTGMVSNEVDLVKLIKKIVKDEVRNLKLENETKNLSTAKKSTKSLNNITKNNSLTKTELLAISKKNNLSLSDKNTKSEILKELEAKNIKTS